MTPAKVEKKVAKIIKAIKEKSLLPPYAFLKPMIVVGNNENEQVLSIIKVTIDLEGVSFLFIFCSSSKAFKPRGVAAAPRPKRLAIRFEQINSNAKESLGNSGNRNFKGLDNTLVKFLINPDSTAILNIPLQKSINKLILKKILKASFVEDNKTFPRFSKFPVIIEIIIPTIIKKFQI